MHNGISGDIIIGIGAKYNTDRWVIAFAALQFIIHADIHVHLPYVLMRDLLCFQVDEDKAFQYVIVKHEVDVLVLLLRMDMLLSCHKSISLPKFHQEFLKIGENALLQVTLGKICILSKS